MKPILYQATETVFSSKGRGTIADAISCTVTEARNGIFDLEMQISVDSKRFSEIALDKIILAKPNPYDWPQPFRIHKITKPINGIVTVLANHISYDLKGIPVNPFTATSCSEAVAMLNSSSLITCPFTITTDIVSRTVMTVAKPYTIRDLMGGMEGSLIDTYGGEYKFNRFSVMLLSERGANRGVKIKYGINLIDLTQEENCSSVYSGVLPYFANENGIIVGDVQRASGTFAVDRILPLDLTQYFTSSYDESATLPTVAQLNTRGAAYVRNNAVGVPKVNLELSFAQLPRKEVHLCDTVTVEFEKMGIETTAKVIETVYDVLEERYRSVKLGDPRANIINSINDETEAREAANVRMQSYLEKTDSAIRAKVSKIGGDNSSFGWEMTDTSHTWYSNEEEVMKATSAGLEIKGKITATSGFIGNGSNGFTIGNTAIYNRLSSLSGNQNGIYLGTDGIALGGGKFKVTSAGALTATSADIKGKITATSGYIGNDSSGFTIGSNAIYNGMESLSDTEHNGVYIGTGGIALGKGAFKVTSSGAVTASNLSITGGTISINNGAFYVSSDGSVTAKSGTFEGNIYAKNIQYSSSNASIGTFSGAGLTDLSILEDKLRNNTISTAKTSAGINTSLGYANFANAVMNNNDTAEHISCKLLTVRGGPLIVSGRVSASYLVGVHKVLSGDDEYDMSIHTHQITEENGVVTIGAADWTGADHSFNIADTDFYKDGVSAVSVTSMIHYTEQGEQTVTWNATNHTLNASVQAFLSNEKNFIRTVVIPADLAYDAGEDSVSVTAIQYYTISGEETVTYNSANKTLSASVQATLTNGNTNGSIRTVTIPADLAFDAGEASVSVSALNYYTTAGEDTVTYNSSNKTLSASVQATLTNGNTSGSIRTVTIPATLAYNAGYDDGEGSVSVTALQYYTVSGEDTVTYNATAKTLNASVQATLSNGNTSGSIRTVTIPATLAYNAGYSDGENSVSTTGIAYYQISGEDTVSYNSTNKTLTASVQATLTNGNTTGSVRSVTIPADLAYDAGYADGEAAGSGSGEQSVTVTSLGLDPDDSVSYSSSVKNYYVPIKAVLSNTKYRITTLTISGQEAYEQGVTAGAETAYASAITAGSAGLPSYSSEDQLYYANTSITATARGTKADGTYYTADRTITVAVDVTNVYSTAKQLGVTEGARTAYVSAITAGSAGTPFYSTEDDVYYANVAITATARGTQAGGSYYTADRTINTAVDVTTVYNAGKTAGQSEGAGGVSVDSVSVLATTASDFLTYDNIIYPTAAALYANGGYLFGRATVALSNNTSSILSFRVPDTASGVTVDSVALNPSVSYGTNKKYVVPVIATASNGATKEVLFSFDATDAYNEGANTLVADAPTVATHSNTHTVIGTNHYVTASINSKAHTTDFSGTTISAMTAGSLAILANQVYADGVTAGENGVSVSSVTALTTDGTNYTTHDFAVSRAASAMYTSGSYMYGRAQINLSNGNSVILRFRVPASAASVTSINVARPNGDMQDWDLSEENHVYVNVNLTALNGSTTLATDTGRVNVDDIVNFFATNTGAVIATDSSNYNTYDDGLTFYVQNFLYTNGNYQYARIQLRNSDGNDLSLIRIQLDKAGSSSGQITITNEATSSSVNPYYGTLPYYAYVNNKHYVYIKAVSTGVANRTQYIDINDIVDYAYALGQQSGSGSSVTVRSVKATSNKTYDSNMDMYYVMVRVTYSDGSWQNFQAWYD